MKIFNKTVNQIYNQILSLRESAALFERQCPKEQDPIPNPLVENVIIQSRDMWGNLWQFRKN